MKNLKLYEHRVSLGANPFAVITILTEDEEKLPDIFRQASLARPSRRDIAKHIGMGVLKAPIAQAAVGQLAAHAAGEVVKHVMSPSKDVAPEYKGGTMPVDITAFAAQNAHRKVSPGPTIKPEEFDTKTEQDYKGLGRDRKIAVPGHPVNTQGFRWTGEQHSGGESMWFRRDEFKHAMNIDTRTPGGREKFNQAWDKAKQAISGHQDIHYAKVDDGVIAYDNPFHERFKDSLDPGIKATHVNSKTGEIKRFKVPVDFDAQELRYPEHINDLGHESAKHLRNQVMQHYSTRVSPTASLDFSLHRRSLRSHGFGSSGFGDPKSMEWHKTEVPKDYDKLMTPEEHYGKPGHEFMRFHGFETHSANSYSYGFKHPDLPGHTVSWSHSESDPVHRWQVHKLTGKKFTYSEPSIGGDAVEENPVAQGEGVGSFHDFMRSKGMDVKPAPSMHDWDSSQRLDRDIPERLKRRTRVYLSQEDSTSDHPDAPKKGWTVAEGSWHDPKPIARGTSAEDLHKFLSKRSKGYENQRW